MPDNLTLTNILDDAAILSLEHQLHLQEVLGDHSWNVDLQRQRFEFTGARPITCTRFHMLGSAAPGPRSWMWGWANPSGVPEPLTALSSAVREFGQRNGIAELASPEVPFDDLPRSNGDPAMVVGLLSDVAKPISGQWTSYNGEAGGGTRVAFLVEHPEFQLPPPRPERVMRVIQQCLASVPMSDHRRALHSYATRRGLGATFAPDHSKLTLTGPGLEAAVDFDQYGRVSDISASLSSPQGH